MKAVLALAAVFALSGCILTTVHDPSQWTKPAATVLQVTFDDMECERQSRDIPGTPDLIVGGIVDIPRIIIENDQRESIYNNCMKDRGYEKESPKRVTRAT
jgi:hypothetical protein